MGRFKVGALMPRAADSEAKDRLPETARLIRQGFPEEVAQRIASGELDMSAEARMARAREQGYDVDTRWVHANTDGISGEGFDNSRLPADDPDRPFNAHWFSTKPSPTKAFRGGRDGNAYTPILSKATSRATDAEVKQVIKETDKYGDDLRRELVDRGYESIVARGHDTIDADELAKNGEVTFRPYGGRRSTLRWEIMPGTEPERIKEFLASDFAKQNPDDQMVRFSNNVIKSPNYDPEKGLQSLELYEGGEHITGYESLDDFLSQSPDQEDLAVFDNTSIRSPWAAFDPQYKGRNILGLDSSTSRDYGSAIKGRLADSAAALAKGELSDAAIEAKYGSATPQGETRQNIRNWIDDGLKRMGFESSGLADKVMTIADFSPLGTVTGLIDAYDSYKEGDMGGVALNASLSAADAFPVGKLAEPLMGIMAGSKARNAPKEALYDAYEDTVRMVEEGGVLPSDIVKETWRKYGAYVGADDLPRFEIDDSAASLVKPDSLYKRNSTLSLYEVLDHPELYRHYPELKDVKVSHKTNMPHNKSGSFRPFDNEIVINANKSPNDQLSSLIHESQHAVQNIEGFNKGGSASDAFKQYRLYRDDPHMLTDPDSIARMMGDSRENNMAYKDAIAYMSTAGEVEARVAQNRLRLSPDERSVRPPTMDMNIPGWLFKSVDPNSARGIGLSEQWVNHAPSPLTSYRY